MTTATLTINLDAVTQNWRTLDAKSAPDVETGAVVKADGYGLDAGAVAQKLFATGVRTFFVAVAEEGAAIRKAIGNIGDIYVFSGMMLTDAETIKAYNLIPLLNSPRQLVKFRMTLPNHPYGVQLDTGMNRLGMEPHDFMSVRDKASTAKLVISHLACADAPNHPQNAVQLQAFHQMTDAMNVRRSLSATGGILLGKDYHFDVCRPGIGLYGGAPFGDAKPVVTVSIPVIQTRDVAVGETVGYSATWSAKRPSKVATLAAGYADGLIRAMGNGALNLWSNGTPCPIIGRVSMDLLTVDITDLASIPVEMDILNAHQTVDKLADQAGTIGYEILTSLGARYNRVYVGAP